MAQRRVPEPTSTGKKPLIRGGAGGVKINGDQVGASASGTYQLTGGPFNKPIVSRTYTTVAPTANPTLTTTIDESYGFLHYTVFPAYLVISDPSTPTTFTVSMQFKGFTGLDVDTIYGTLGNPTRDTTAFATAKYGLEWSDSVYLEAGNDGNATPNDRLDMIAVAGNVYPIQTRHVGDGFQSHYDIAPTYSPTLTAKLSVTNLNTGLTGESDAQIINKFNYLKRTGI